MLVIGLSVTAEVVLTGASWLGWFGPPGPDAPENAPMVVGIVAAVGIPLGCLILLIGYVSQDAKRLGMNAALWTLLVIMLLPAWLLTGFMIYFLIREPLPYHSTGCGTMVSARYNYCPNCKCNLRPACSECQREVSDRDRYCPYCGTITLATIIPAIGGRPSMTRTAKLGNTGNSTPRERRWRCSIPTGSYGRVRALPCLAIGRG